MHEHVCPPQPPCYRCQNVIYPREPWWSRLSADLWYGGRWYGFGGLIPEFEYEKRVSPGMYRTSVVREASIVWWRQRLSLSWSRERRSRGSA